MSGRFNILFAASIAAALIASPAFAANAGGESVTDYVRAFWPVFVVCAGLVGAGVILGLATRFPTIAAFKSVKDRVLALEGHKATHDLRIAAVEGYCVSAPTRQELQEDISELRTICAGFGSELSGIKEQGKTTNTYLHMLLEQQLSK